MPRRSARQTTAAATEQSSVRVTRRSVREQKPEKNEEEVASSPVKSDTSKTPRRSTKSSVEASPVTPSPPAKGPSKTTRASGDGKTPRGRGRGRGGRGQTRGKGWSRKVADEEDSEEEEVDETPSEAGDQDYEVKPTTQSKPRGRGTGRGAGRSSRGRRGQGRKSQGEEEEEEEEYQPEEEEVKKLKTPSPRKATRKGRSGAKEPEEDESPRRRSGRRAAKEAEEKIRTEAAAEEASKEDEEEPMETETVEEKQADDKEAVDKSKQLKRKHDEVGGDVGHTSPAKKLKTDQPASDDAKSADESMPNIEEISEESAGEDAAKEVGKQTERMEDAPVLEAETKPVEAAKPEEALKKVDQSKQAEPTPGDKPKSVGSSPVKEPADAKVTGDSKAKKSPKKDEPEMAAAAPTEKSTQPSQVPAKEAAPISGQETSTQNTMGGSQTSSGGECHDADPLKDYVVVNMEDVPPPDSSEVSTSIPVVHVTPPDQDNNIDHSKKQDSSSSSANQAPNPPEAAPKETSQLAAAANSVSSPNSKPTDCNNVVNAEHHTDKLINNSSTKSDSQDPLLHRRFVANPAIDVNSVPLEKTFTLVSYNILADCHAQRGEYPWVSEEQLSLEYRHQRLMKELKYLDADIICIQEIGPDHYNKLLQPQLSQLGYQGAYIKRPSDYFNEGEATFVRTSRFTVQSNELIDLSTVAKRDLDNSGIDEATLSALKKSVTSPGVAVITKVKCAKTGRVLTIANVHIMWEWFKRMDIQCVQAAATIRELVTLAGGASQPHIICGDFNAVPGSPVYQLTHEGYLNDSSVAKLQQLAEVKLDDGRVCPMVNLWWRGFQHTSSNLKSAYLTTTGTEPMSSKFPHDGIVRQVDYIWFSSGSLDVLGVAETAPLADIQQGIPNAVYPSDHVSTKAMLAFRD